MRTKDDGPYLLSLDAGTGSVRGLLFDLQGNPVSSEIRGRSYQPDPSGEAFLHVFDAPGLWRTLCELIGCLLRNTGADPESILVVSATCQRFSFLFLDDRGEVLYAGPNMDPRGIFTQADIEARMGVEYYRLTGQWPPLLSGLSKLLWFRQEAPEIFARIRTVFMLDDWMSYQLSGERTAEITAASGSGFVELATPKWSEGILGAFDLDRDLFPPIVFPGQVIGAVHSRAAAETGLKAGTPVVAGAADTQCALLGAGLWGPGRVGIAAGTTAPVCLWMDAPLVDPEERLWSSWHVAPRSWLLEANGQWSGSVVQWLRDFFSKAGVPTGPDLDLYRWMEQQAGRLPPGAHDTLACLGPVLMDARQFHIVKPGIFLFPPPGHLLTESPPGPGHLIRAALENIAFSMRGNLERVSRAGAANPDRLYLTGGLAKNRLFCQILSDCAGLPVLVCSETEGSALGAAVCAAAGIRAFADLAAAQKSLVATDRTYEPCPAHTELYQPLYERWCEVYEKLEGL